MDKRERFGSRIGFILVSAGCAVGLGNVWKFPYMCGQYGGAAFILIYLFFLVILGWPILTCELAVGRASQKSIAASYDVLAPEKSHWHLAKLIGIPANYLLMMFYTMVGGWMLYYAYLSATGAFSGASVEQVTGQFDTMLDQPKTMVIWTYIALFLALGVCCIGMQKGVEKVTKVMMISLFLLMGVLVVRSVTLKGAAEGLKFYLIPDFQKLGKVGWGNAIFGALSQAFFTLSIGIGSMAIFGSYLDKSHSLPGEAANIVVLDTIVALMAGIIVIPACFAFGVEPGSGPKLVFITLPNIFVKMPGGRIWGTMFFTFLSFAALSTIIAVFENIISFAMDLGGMSRRKAVLFNLVAMMLLCLPCILGFNVLSGITPLGKGTNIMDLEDFLVSNNFLPLGSLIYLLFCTHKNGWGWQNYIQEVNSGKGMSFPVHARFLMTHILPLVVVAIYLKGYYDFFIDKGTALLVGWMIAAFALLGFILYIVSGKPKSDS